MKERVRSCLGFIFVMQLLLMAGQAQSFVVMRTIVQTTQSNSTTLVEHSCKLSNLDRKFEAIFESRFTPEFSSDLKEYIVHGNR